MNLVNLEIMGSQVIANCKCGVNQTISVGGGKYSFRKINYFPALCPHCNEIVQTNLIDKKLRCPLCNKGNTIPYNDPKLIGEVGKETISHSYDYVLTDGTYYCSNCEGMTIHFKRGSLLWD